VSSSPTLVLAGPIVLSAVGANPPHDGVTHSRPSTATLTQIVTDHGFWELGRFSVAYGMLFGESPSETLSQRTWQCSSGLSSPAVADT
jgi:hypothetical protein